MGESWLDDYYKVVGYACLYKGMGETVNAVPAEELTVSLFRETYPRELVEQLKKQGAAVEESFPGIYYVKGSTLFDTQIVVTGQLAEVEHSSLRILSKNVREMDVRRFLKESEALHTQGDLNNMDAVLQVSISANKMMYDQVKEDWHMCEALKELMKNEINEGIEQGIEQELLRGVS